MSEISTTTSNDSINDNSIWLNYKLRTREGERRIYEQYRVYNENPEDHPSYAQEWETFWNIKCNKEYTDMQLEPTYDQIKQEWIQFWIVRLKYLEMLDISEFRSTIWEHVRKEICSYSRKSLNSVSDYKESSQNLYRSDLAEKRSKYDESSSYRFRRINESTHSSERNYRYSTSRRDCHSQQDCHRGRNHRHDCTDRSKEIIYNRSRREEIKPAFDEYDNEMNITVVSCCCKILGIAEVSESVRSQITSLLVQALDYEKHSAEFVMSEEDMEFFKLVRYKIKESLDAGHIRSKKSYVIEDIIENITILIDNRRDNWISLDEHDTVLDSLASRCISPIRAPLDENSVVVPDDLRLKIPLYRTMESGAPLEYTKAKESDLDYESTQNAESAITSKIEPPVISYYCNSGKSEESEETLIGLPSSSNVDSSEKIGDNEDNINIVRSLSDNSLLSSDSSTMPPGVYDYERDVIKSKPLSTVSSQDSIVSVQIMTSSEDLACVSAVEVENPEKTLQIKNQQHEYMKDLTDDELKYLLKNFNQLTDDEQQSLIKFLEKIDQNGDENRMKELKNYMLSCEDNEEYEKDVLNNKTKELVECVEQTEVLEHQGGTKQTTNDDTYGSPILPKNEEKHWNIFKVTLNVEDSLRKVDVVEEKDVMIDEIIKPISSID